MASRFGISSILGLKSHVVSLQVSKFPSLERWFPDGIDRPIQFPFTKEKERQPLKNLIKPQLLPERIFHFTKEKIAHLKSKANAEANTDKISSLQALLTHLWRSIVRCQSLEPQENVHYVLAIDARSRTVPPLPEDYFGNAVLAGGVTIKAGELLEGGLGKVAWEMNKMISLQTHEKIKDHYESWVRNPKPITFSSNILFTSSSQRFDVYGNDFGWGNPVAVRCGCVNNRNGNIILYAGAEAGTIDILVTLPYEISEALGNDRDFVDTISS